MTQYAFFLEPRGGLREVLLDLKRRVAAVQPDAPYGAHPPHATVLVAALPETEAWRPDAAAAVAAREPFAVAVRGACVFYDDAATAGGQTVALAVDRTPALFDLQRGIADAVAPYRAATSAADCPFRGEAMVSSFTRYGFPFVGEHWIPHLTIASLRLPRDHGFVAELRARAQEVTGSLEVTTVGLWRVDGEEHRRLGTLTCAGGAG